MLDLSYPNIRSFFQQHTAGGKRSESAAFLIWYFENYLRLDTLDAIDSVCDQRGDRGIDGIYLNEEANVIEVYQSKLIQNANATIGDRSLREFYGTLAQLETDEAIDTFVEAAGDAEVARLVKRLDLKSHINEYDLVGYFICNSALDSNGQSFLDSCEKVRFFGMHELKESYISSERSIPAVPPVSFDITGYQVSEYVVDDDHRAIIAPVKATQLVNLEGISNQSIFAYNVRGPLGRTKVNRDIARTIADASKHKLFPLFHNGITVVAESVSLSQESVDIENYYIVNGCQSINALYQNRRSLTEDLRILTKLIRAEPSSKLSEMVTKFSNNQNGVKARDFKSNNQIQIRLQNEVEEIYGDRYFYEIKRGEDNGGREVVTNELAGQYLMAFDLKMPWITHRKYQILEEKHSELFGRPVVTAHRIVLCHIIAKKIDELKVSIQNQLFAQYVLTKFLIMYILRLILEEDEGGVALLSSPHLFVNEIDRRERFTEAVDQLLCEIITDIDAEIRQLGEDFDYRGRLREARWSDKLAHQVAATHKSW